MFARFFPAGFVVLLASGCGGSSTGDLFGGGGGLAASAGGGLAVGGTPGSGGGTSFAGETSFGGFVNAGGGGNGAGGSAPGSGGNAGSSGTGGAFTAAGGGASSDGGASSIGGDAGTGGACQDGAQTPCTCPDGSQGVATCSGGVVGGCASCPISRTGCPVFNHDVLVGGLVRHTHRWGTTYKVWSVDANDTPTLLWTTEDWQNDIEKPFSEPMLMKAGTGFRYECDYQNTEDHDLRFGEHATDEMCNLFGGWWVVNEGDVVGPRNCLITKIDGDGIGRSVGGDTGPFNAISD